MLRWRTNDDGTVDFYEDEDGSVAEAPARGEMQDPAPVVLDREPSAGDAGGSPLQTGTVTFWVSTRKLCVAKLSDGKGSCSAAFPNPGPKTIVGDYSGDSTHKASTGTAPLTIDK